ncbi:MAG TPA: polyphosphate kinase 1 [Acidobacteriaceae bacterium]|jgi:polyphosphate kinase
MATAKQPSTRQRRSSAPQSLSATECLGSPNHRFFHRDESWLLFNRRVLEEADDTSNPLLERVKFLAITASNLDEFVEIRVAGVLQQIEQGIGLPQLRDESGCTADERMIRLREALHGFAADQDRTWLERVQPALHAKSIRFVQWKSMTEAQREFAGRFFLEQVDPLLTPVTIDPSHPFPRVLNKAVCLALLLRNKRKATVAAKRAHALGVITIPRSLPSLIELPRENGRFEFLLLADLIEAHVEGMFRGYDVVNRAAFRVTRNSNLYMQEEESRSVLDNVREELHNRRKGDVVRLEIDASASEAIAERLRVNFELEEWQVFRTRSPINLSRLMNLYSVIKDASLKFAEFHGRRLPLSPKSKDIFDELREHDILLHHPYDSYSGVESFVATAASDPRVISSKMTLYRTSADSSLFRALTEAALSQSKDVTVVVELMARFDEASNIRWARDLEDAGVQVFHGILGLKTHCKLALLVRRDPDGVIRSYAHLGTGNYNPITARFYTDISLLTCRPEITEAVQHVFRYLTAGWQADDDAYRPLMVAPLTLAKDTLALISREAAHARAGRPARIIAKMNALLDAPTIEALYAASEAGVEIDLIIRGMCALRVGVPGMSSRIRVRSIVGRFLEHSRIFWFANGGHEEVFAGSADWMPRNLYERCEVLYPVAEKDCVQRLRHEILEAYLRDNVKARIMQPDGTYTRPVRTGKRLSAQDWLMQHSHVMGPEPAPKGDPKPIVRRRSQKAAADAKPAATSAS